MDLSIDLLTDMLVLGSFAIWCIRPNNGAPWMKFLGAQLLAAVLVEGAGFIMRKAHVENQWLYNLYMPLEFFMLTGMAGSIARKASWLRRIAPWSTAPFLFVYLFHMVAHPMMLATEALLVGGLVLVALHSALLLTLANSSDRPLLRAPVFWLCLSTILYFGCFAPFMGVLNYAMGLDDGTAVALCTVNDVVSGLRYALILICLMLIPARSVRLA